MKKIRSSPAFDVIANWTVWIAGLGYFIDLFDITLFGVVRVASLKSMGLVNSTEILDAGIRVYNAQAVGLMLGGLLWGWISDKRGRLSVLFGSILLYSLGNIANAFVTNVDAYVWIRFLTGIGLAGELGSAITLVAEVLPKQSRGLGTTVVATLGMLGAVTASFVGQLMDWNHAYLLGGGLGLLLLATRFKIKESDMFRQTEATASVHRGDLLLLLKPQRFLRYLRTILVGIPIYFTTGILFTFAPEITKALNVQGEVSAASAIMWGTIGITLGDVFSGLLSQWLKSRQKAVAFCLVCLTVVASVYLMVPGLPASSILVLCFMAGIFAGYWAVNITMAAEQFGTNLRGTVATTVPNFIRGSAAMVATLFAVLKTHLTTPNAAILVGVIFFGLALASLFQLEETFGKDLNFNEEA